MNGSFLGDAKSVLAGCIIDMASVVVVVFGERRRELDRR